MPGEEPSPAATVIKDSDEQDDKQFIIQSNNVDAVFVARATADRERYKFAVESLKTEIVLKYQEIEKLKTHIKEDHLSKITSIRRTIQSYEKALKKLWEVVNLHKTCYAKEVEESEQLRRVNSTLEAEVRNLKERITQLEGFGKSDRFTASLIANLLSSHAESCDVFHVHRRRTYKARIYSFAADRSNLFAMGFPELSVVLSAARQLGMDVSQRSLTIKYKEGAVYVCFGTWYIRHLRLYSSWDVYTEMEE